MLLKPLPLFLFFCFFILSLGLKGQIYYTMGAKRNVLTVTSGLNNNFANTNVGFARREYIKRLKWQITGLLEVALSLNETFFTRHIIKKGIQINLYKQGDFLIPFTFASSSIIRQDKAERDHDVTAEFTFNPGIYTDRYTLALDLRYENIVFRHHKYSQQYKHDHVGENVKNHWNEPLTPEFKTGIIAALNVSKACVFYLKSGYEDNPFINLNKYKYRWYAIAGFGYKFGTKPFVH